MNRLYCNTPNEISSKAIKENFKCTRVHLPTNVDVANLESDRLVARQKKQDLNEFDILDKKSQYTMTIKARTLVILKD